MPDIISNILYGFARQIKALLDSNLSKIIVYTLVYVMTMYFIGMNEYEKQFTSNIFKKLKKVYYRDKIK